MYDLYSIVLVYSVADPFIYTHNYRSCQCVYECKLEMLIHLPPNRMFTKYVFHLCSVFLIMHNNFLIG